MIRILFSIPCFFVVVFLVTGQLPAVADDQLAKTEVDGERSSPDNKTHRVLCCGGAEVFLIDPSRPSVKQWTWTADASPSIPEAFRTKFRSTDDCKPYKEDQILITSSSGGVAIIERPSRKCLFLADSRNAHSACLLPDNGIAVASSYGGDQLEFYDRNDKRRPAQPVQTIPLKGAHGTVWDARRGYLWALGGDELLKLMKLKTDKHASAARRWSVVSRLKLPTPGGHDLSPLHGDSHLFVTTNTQVLLFNRESERFTAHKEFGDHLKIKSVDQHPTTGRIVFHKASKAHWSSDTIRFVKGDPLRLPGERLYKIRWDYQTKLP